MEAPNRLAPASPAARPGDALPLRSANRQILRALMALTSAAILARATAMGTVIVVTSQFGEGAAMDAYFIAAAVPGLVASLIDSAIEVSVVPAYARMRGRGDSGQASKLFSTLFNLTLMAGTALTLMMLVFRHQVILISAPAADSYRMGVAVTLAPVIFPALVLSMALALVESVLNAEGQFGWPAYAGLLVPLSTGIGVLMAGTSLGVVVLGIGTLIGLCLQGCAFVVRMRRAKIVYRPILDLHNPALGPVLTAAWPALIGSCIAMASPLIDQMFASALSAGNISALTYALKLLNVPLGVIFVAVGRAMLPHLSRQVGVGDLPGFKATLRLYIWVVSLGTILVTALLFALAHPLVHILFERGAFLADDTDRTATTFRGFVVGLPLMAMVFLLVRALSALAKIRVLLYANTFFLIANAIFDYFLVRVWQSLGIALATSMGYVFIVAILLVSLRRVIGSLELLTPPPELLHVLHSARSRHDAVLWRTRKTSASAWQRGDSGE